MGGLIPKAPTVAAVPSPPQAPVGSSTSPNNANQNTQLSAQQAASLQGGTVMGANNGSTTTKTLLGS